VSLVVEKPGPVVVVKKPSLVVVVVAKPSPVVEMLVFVPLLNYICCNCVDGCHFSDILGEM
jgi:hypothetical protein